MKKIKLTQGMFAFVDDLDFTYLSKYKWHIDRKGKNIYAATTTRENNKCSILYMHRLIMGNPKDKQIDHIDHNGLNNQRQNLRICTIRENRRNRRLSGKSKYIGVCFVRNKYIKAQIRVGDKHIHLGHFKTEIEAAIAYDNAAKQHKITFANLNFKD